MEEPNFWNDAERSAKLVQEAKNLKDTVELYRGLEQEYEDIQVMIEMGYEENDASMMPENLRKSWKSSAWALCCLENMTDAMLFFA